MGSHFGDSQLIKLLPESNGSWIAVEQVFSHLAPITDFCLVDSETQGQGQMVACAGAYKHGSLKVLRHGVGLEEVGQLEGMQELKRVWSLRSSFNATNDSILVLSFIVQTRIQVMDEEGLGELESLHGWSLFEPTLGAANMVGDYIVQATPSKLILLDCERMQQVSEWIPPEASQITQVSINPTQVVLSIGQGRVFCLSLHGSQFKEQGSLSLGFDVACLDISPIASELAVDVCVLGDWDNTIHVYSLPLFKEITNLKIQSETIPRSILQVQLEQTLYLMVGLGDGQLLTWQIGANYELSDPKTVALGTQPIGLDQFKSHGNKFVFVASDRPTIISSRLDKLVFSNVNLKDISCITSFNTPYSEQGVAVGCEDMLKIGVIESIQKLHIKTYPLGETARRISYDEQSSTFGIVCVKMDMTPSGEAVETSSFKLIHGKSFESIMV